LQPVAASCSKLQHLQPVAAGPASRIHPVPACSRLQRNAPDCPFRLPSSLCFGLAEFRRRTPIRVNFASTAYVQDYRIGK
jgi:hypothetical protein